MSGPGRPTASRTANRRRRVLAALAADAASTPATVEAIAAKVGATATTVRGDLEAIRADAEAQPETDAMSAELVEQLEAAKSGPEIAAALQAVVSGALRGIVSEGQARLALEAAKIAARAAGGGAPGPVEPEPGERSELARARATGLSDRQIEQRVGGGGLPQGFLSKARSGGHTGPRSEPSWARLRAWLDESFPLANAPPTASPRSGSSATQEILDAIEVSNDFESLDKLAKRVMQAIVEEDLDGALGKLVVDAIKERRQVLSRSLEEQRALDSRKPVEIKIVHVNDWRKKADAAVARAEDEA